MKTQIFIDTTQWHWAFTIFYLIAFVIAACILYYCGKKRDYPLGSWLLIIFTGVVFFIIGDKISTFAPSQWHQLFTEFSLPAAHEKNALGGILGLFTGILLARSLLNFKYPVFDHLAIALPVALGISRIGCLLAGCCYGIPTHFPLAISYDNTSIAFHAQLAQGLIDSHRNFSLAMHPVQLYQTIGCFLIAFLVWKTRHFWKSNGSQLLFSMLCYGVMRFLVEFMVDPLSNTFASHGHAGLNLPQLMIAIAFFPALTVLLYKERKVSVKSNNGPVRFAEFRKILLVIFLGTILVAGRAWFGILEMLTITLFFIPVVIFLMLEVYRNHTIPRLRWAFPAIFLVCFTFMSQKTDTSNKFTEAGIDGIFGRYYEDLSLLQIEYCASEKYSHLEYIKREKRNFYETGATLFYSEQLKENFSYALGGKIFYGQETGYSLADYPDSKNLIGINVFNSYDWKNIGFGIGCTFGNIKVPIKISYSRKSNLEGKIIAADYSNPVIWPNASLRFGNRKILFSEIRFDGSFAFSTPYSLYSIGLGSGFGKSNSFRAIAGYCDGYYLHLTYPVQNRLILNAVYANNFRNQDRNKSFLSFGIHYRFYSKH